MIVTRVSYGLGNQMFQYALGRQAASLRHTELKLDLSRFEKRRGNLDRLLGLAPREYELGVFRIEAAPATRDDLRELRKKHRSYRFGGSGRRIVYRETRPFAFDGRVLRCGEDAIFLGLWQNEKYFRDIAPLVRREFRFRDAPDRINGDYIERLRSENSVSVHVRRGDYASSAVLRRSIGTCAVEYYRRAMSHVAERVDDTRFHVFSDDPDWARANLDTGFPMTVVTHNTGRSNHEDLRLMSHCKHHIIANSTFSWWAAWLNRADTKIVVAPKTWFLKSPFNADDLVPAEWTRL